MKTSMDRLHAYDSLTSEIVSNEVEFLSETLGNLRDSGEISNDAYLEAGGIQGGLSLIASLIDQEVSDDEIDMRVEERWTQEGRAGGRKEVHRGARSMRPGGHGTEPPIRPVVARPRPPAPHPSLQEQQQKK